MDYGQLLLSKHGFATHNLAKYFLTIDVGSKILTVSEFSDAYNLARGTVQNSIKLLQDNEAIILESRGHLGTFFVKKNFHILLKLSGINSILGAMPLPYSKRYEGLATGLISSMDNQFDLPTSLAYMRGATKRISMVLADRYDFAVISKFAATEFAKINQEIQIVKSLGKHTYLSEHIIVFHDVNIKEIKDGMIIGIDVDSIDQKKMTEKACENCKVEYVQIDYSQILSKIKSGEIDAAIWNKDEITDKVSNVNYVSFEFDDYNDTEAVIVCKSSSNEIAKILKDIIDTKLVIDVQQLVLDNKITPSY